MHGVGKTREERHLLSLNLLLAFFVAFVIAALVAGFYFFAKGRVLSYINFDSKSRLYSTHAKLLKDLNIVFNNMKSSALAASHRTDITEAISEFSAAFHKANPSVLKKAYVDVPPLFKGEYDNVHQKFHRSFLTIALKKEFDDLLIIDRRGFVVYSALKYSDFASHISEVPNLLLAVKNANSGIGFGVRGKPPYYLAVPVERFNPEDGKKVKLGYLAFRISDQVIRDYLLFDSSVIVFD